MIPELFFDSKEANAAYEDWNCNCGPAALAAILGKTLDEVRPAVEAEGFAERHYTNPTMMEGAIRRLGGRIVKRISTGGSQRRLDFPKHGLARIQWTGPWTQPGSNPKWAYGKTHWIATWLMEAGVNQNWYCIFDVNGGLMNQADWERHIVPFILPQRADGGWFITHSWEVAA